CLGGDGTRGSGSTPGACRVPHGTYARHGAARLLFRSATSVLLSRPPTPLSRLAFGSGDLQGGLRVLLERFRQKRHLRWLRTAFLLCRRGVRATRSAERISKAAPYGPGVPSAPPRMGKPCCHQNQKLQRETERRYDRCVGSPI